MDGRQDASNLPRDLSLAARLYTDQGIDAQALLGHKSADMTAIYRDVRGAEWIEVKTA